MNDAIMPLNLQCHYDPDGTLIGINTPWGIAERIGITAPYIIEADRRFLTPDEGGITFHCETQAIRYQFIEWHRDGYWICELVSVTPREVIV